MSTDTSAVLHGASAVLQTIPMNPRLRHCLTSVLDEVRLSLVMRDAGAAHARVTPFPLPAQLPREKEMGCTTGATGTVPGRSRILGNVAGETCNKKPAFTPVPPPLGSIAQSLTRKNPFSELQVEEGEIEEAANLSFSQIAAAAAVLPRLPRPLTRPRRPPLLPKPLVKPTLAPDILHAKKLEKGDVLVTIRASSASSLRQALLACCPIRERPDADTERTIMVHFVPAAVPEEELRRGLVRWSGRVDEDVKTTRKLVIGEGKNSGSWAVEMSTVKGAEVLIKERFHTLRLGLVVEVEKGKSRSQRRAERAMNAGKGKEKEEKTQEGRKDDTPIAPPIPSPAAAAPTQSTPARPPPTDPHHPAPSPTRFPHIPCTSFATTIRSWADDVEEEERTMLVIPDSQDEDDQQQATSPSVDKLTGEASLASAESSSLWSRVPTPPAAIGPSVEIEEPEWEVPEAAEFRLSRRDGALAMRELVIVTYNIRKTALVLERLMESSPLRGAQPAVDILLIQELPPSIHTIPIPRGWTLLTHPPHAANGEEPTYPRSIALISPRFPLPDIQLLPILSRDVIGFDLRSAGGESVRILGVYNPHLASSTPNRTVRDTLPPLLEDSDPTTPLLVGGDFNLRHPTWDPLLTSLATNEAEELKLTMDEAGLVLLRHGGEATFEGFDGSPPRFIDIVWGNLRAEEMVVSALVDLALECGSDHRPIRISLRLNLPPPPPPPPSPTPTLA
ncbi:hypothetical protein JCM11641_003368 [Rhodosporidiobolus odoratus]